MEGDACIYTKCNLQQCGICVSNFAFCCVEHEWSDIRTPSPAGFFKCLVPKEIFK